MKLSHMEREDLVRRLSEARGRTGVSDAEIGRRSGVHASQVGRICRGEFRTASNNVVQVCKVLGLPLERIADPAAGDAAWLRLTASMREAWDRTPQGAETLVRLLRAVAEIGRLPKERR